MLPPIPQQYVKYLRPDGVFEGSTHGDAEPGYDALWPLEKIADYNSDVEIEVYAPRFIAFGGDGGGELLVFDACAQPAKRYERQDDSDRGRPDPYLSAARPGWQLCPAADSQARAASRVSAKRSSPCTPEAWPRARFMALLEVAPCLVTGTQSCQNRLKLLNGRNSLAGQWDGAPRIR